MLLSTVRNRDRCPAGCHIVIPPPLRTQMCILVLFFLPCLDVLYVEEQLTRCPNVREYTVRVVVYVCPVELSTLRASLTLRPYLFFLKVSVF